MKFTLVFCTILSLSLFQYIDSFEGLTQQQLDHEWNQFQVKFPREYQTVDEVEVRKENFRKNLEKILKHNEKFAKGQAKYRLGINQFADWTLEEFHKLLGIETNEKIFKKNQHYLNDETYGKYGLYTENNIKDLPEEVDWTKKNVVTPVMYQGNCASGYAIGPVQALESAYAIKTGKLIPLSVQQVIDCPIDYAMQQCQGGIIQGSFDYMIKFGGLDTAESYPYVGPNSTMCTSDKGVLGAKIKDYFHVKRFDEEAMQNAVATKGPVAIAIDARSEHFMLYKDGIYDYDDCQMVWLNHGMTVVGYGVENGFEYWKLKNSLGTSWGIDGYVHWARHQSNLCGVASTAEFPIV